MSGGMSGGTSEGMSGGTSGGSSEGKSGGTSEGMSRGTSEGTSGGTSGGLSAGQRLRGSPEDAADRHSSHQLLPSRGHRRGRGCRTDGCKAAAGRRAPGARSKYTLETIYHDVKTRKQELRKISAL